MTKKRDKDWELDDTISVKKESFLHPIFLPQSPAF